MFHTSKNVFTCLPDTDFVDEETYKNSLYSMKGISNNYIKTRASVNIPSHLFSKKTWANTYRFQLSHYDDAYMEFNIPDPNHYIFKVEFIVGGNVIETFYWNEKTLSWRARFNKNCPFFYVCSPFMTAYIDIFYTRDAPELIEYIIEMTKIRFRDDLQMEINKSSPFDTFMNGKIIRYKGGGVELHESSYN